MRGGWGSEELGHGRDPDEVRPNLCNGRQRLSADEADHSRQADEAVSEHRPPFQSTVRGRSVRFRFAFAIAPTGRCARASRLSSPLAFAPSGFSYDRNVLKVRRPASGEFAVKSRKESTRNIQVK